MDKYVRKLPNVKASPICAGYGSMSQADIPGGGQQCTCIAMTFLCLSLSEALRTNSEDIDNILRDGTFVYQSHIETYFGGHGKYLLIDELPEYVTIRQVSYKVTRLNVFSGLIGTTQSDNLSLIFSLNDALSRVFQSARACYLTIGHSPAYTSSIRKLNDNRFWYFDSHSRSRAGTLSPNGSAVLIEVQNLYELNLQISDLAKSLFGSSYDVPFEVVPVNCQEIETMNILPAKHEDTSHSKSTNSDFFPEHCQVESNGRSNFIISIIF